MEQFVTTFARIDEFRKAESALRNRSLPFTAIGPEAYAAAVDVPAIVVDDAARRSLYSSEEVPFVCAGWVEYRVADAAPARASASGSDEDVFGKAMVMVLQPCIAAPDKLRFVAHLTGDLTEVFPYMNSVMPNAFYNVNGPTFTFMDSYRMITAYPRRVAVAKADTIKDVWRILSLIRDKANECWKNRAAITPSNQLRRKPPALEIYFRLPKTNCGACGEKTCMAFALRLWNGQAAPARCAPVFGGAHAHMKDALVEICQGLGVHGE